MPLDDYTSILANGAALVPDPRQQLAQDIQIKMARMKIDQAQEEIDRQKMFQHDLEGVGQKPDAHNISALMLKYPEFTDKIKSAWDVKEEATKQADLTQLGQIYSPAASGNWDLALKSAQARLDADHAAGNADEQDQAFVDQIKAAASGDESARKSVLTALGTQIAAVSGPEHFATVYGALKGGYTLDQGAARYDDNGQMVAHSPFIKDAEGNIRLWDDDGSGTPPPPAADSPDTPPPSGGFDNAVATVLSNEGGYNPRDMNGAPVNFGINAKANAAELRKLGVSNIKDLTRDQAVQIYRDKYWKGSGAEDLPANLQTPFFDVYIRNEKIAKHALAQSGGDPAKFMQLSSAYFQNLAKKPNGAPYGKAWANRDAKNLAIATGQAPAGDAAPAAAEHASTTERFPVVIPGKPKDAPDGYEWTADGKSLRPIPGGPKDTTATDNDPLAKYGIGQQETGPSVLGKLPANIATQVKALAEGRLPMPSSFALAKPYWQNLLQLTAQYDPTFDAANAPARKAAITAFTGNGKAAQTVGSVNRVANHLNTLMEASKNLAGPDTGFGPLNKVLATTGQAFDPNDAKAYDTAVGFVAGELEKIARNSPGTEAGVERVVKNLDRHNSSATREAAIKTAVDIISGAIDPLKEQYNSAFTNDSTRPKIPWVTPKAQKVFRDIAGVDLSLTGAGADTNSSGDDLPAGATVVGTYHGKRVIEVNGKRMVEQ